MRIAYLIHWNEGPDSGVHKKIVSQVREWTRRGNEVALFVFTARDEAERELRELGIEAYAVRYEGWRSRFPKFRTLSWLVSQWKPDVVYHRYDLFYPSLGSLLRKVPTVLEINTNDLSEMKLQGALRYWYHRLTRAIVLKESQGNVYVSRELSEEESYSKYAKNAIVIGNGIELDDFPSEARPAEGEIRFVFIGTPGQAWHGVDKIMLLARLKPQWTFDLIGIHAQDMPGEALPNVRFHGKLPKSRYQPLMQQAHIAIGSLAMHRASLKEGSPLKVREYLAYGLPVVIGYSDTDFASGSPFILELPNEQDNVERHAERIGRFVDEWSGRRVPRDAIGHLDTKHKEALRVSYMRRLAGKGESP